MQCYRPKNADCEWFEDIDYEIVLVPSRLRLLRRNRLLWTYQYPGWYFIAMVATYTDNSYCQDSCHHHHSMGDTSIKTEYLTECNGGGDQTSIMDS